MCLAGSIAHPRLSTNVCDGGLVAWWSGLTIIIEVAYITLSLFHTPFTPEVTSGASTKLCICQCEQMSFQKPFESTCISKFLESRRKIIPCFRSGIREASLTELALHYWKFISESVRRSESSSAGQISGPSLLGFSAALSVSLYKRKHIIHLSID